MLNELNYTKVKSIVNQIDPIGLISSGAPEDEYNNQINEIVGLLQENVEINFLAEEIYKIFVQSFDEETAGDKKIYLKIAEEMTKK